MRKISRQHLCFHFSKCAGQLHSCRSGTNNHQCIAARTSFPSFRCNLFKSQQNLIPDLKSLRGCFHGKGILLQIGIIEVIGTAARCNHQTIIGNITNICSNFLLLRNNRRHFCKKNIHSLRTMKDASERKRNTRRIQTCTCDLIEQGLKLMMILPVD